MPLYPTHDATNTVPVSYDAKGNPYNCALSQSLTTHGELSHALGMNAEPAVSAMAMSNEISSFFISRVIP